MLHDNWSKNHLIFYKYIARSSSLPKKIGPLRPKIFEVKIFLIFESRFLREYLIYRLKILTIYYTYWRLYLVKISRDYLHLFKKIIYIL